MLISDIIKSGSMFEYAKVILPKVCFAKDLFTKELNKCIGWVEPNEVQKLCSWCFKNFKEKYPDVLKEAFKGIAA